MSGDCVELDGKVVEACKGGNFRVKVQHGDAEHILLAYVSGKMRKFNINIAVGDQVKVEVSPYSLDKGRIIFRKK